MRKLVFAAIALAMGAGEAARADAVLVLNSDEASYSILSRSSRIELARYPVGREPHHVIVTPSWAKARAVAAPIPCPAAVTTQILSFSRMSSSPHPPELMSHHRQAEYDTGQ